jgi:MFS family permease
MSFGFLGIQFGWGLQMANMSSIYEMLGAEESELPLLWLAAPVTGLIIQPIIGYMSDRTWNSLGRRRPYFLVGAILASIALVLMPNSSALWMAAGLLWILDASVNVSMEPFRAFVGDLLPNEQRKSGFAMQSLLIGLGAVLSSALPFILTNGFGVSKEATLDSPIPPSVKMAFYIGAGVFFAAVLYTVLTTREYPPENMEEFLAMKRESTGPLHIFKEIVHGVGSMPTAMRQLAWVQFFTWLALFCMWIFFVPAVGKGVFGGKPLGISPDQREELHSPEGLKWVAAGASLAKAYEARKAEVGSQLRQNDKPRPWYYALQQMFGFVPASPDPGALIDANAMAELIRQSPVDQAYEAYRPQIEADIESAKSSKPWYQTLFHADPSAWSKEKKSPLVLALAAALKQNDVSSPESSGVSAAAEKIQSDLALGRRYQEGSAWGGICFSMYNLIAFFFAFVLLGLTRFMGAKPIHIICLMIGSAGLISAILVKSPSFLLISMAGVGIAWASILSMPYAILSNVIPGSKMGFYMGVFNFFIVLPQIFASVALGKIVQGLFAGDAMKAVLLGGISMGLAALLTLRVESTDNA